MKYRVIPPLIGFFAKQQILLAAMQVDYYFISVVAILTSVIGAAYYLRIVKFIYFYDDVFMPYSVIQFYAHKNKENINLTQIESTVLDTSSEDLESQHLASNGLSLVIAILTSIIFLFVIKPYLLLNVIYMMSIPLFQM